MTDLFSIPESEPPLIHRLRKRYDETRRTYLDALEWSDESGEPVPDGLLKSMERAEHELILEEVRIARL